jgi:LysM repeat protein
MDDKARVWIARILAPIAFLAAATLLVVLVQRALDDDGGASGSTNPAETVVVSTEVAPETGATGEQQNRRFYRIRTGDTLAAIAQRFDTTVEQLLELNPGIDPLALTPNQRIRVA